mgnify:CR=1 FL=1
MTRLTIEVDGQVTVVTDIAPYRAERDKIIAQLSVIFTDFENGPVSALNDREPEIVDLVNRYAVLEHVIDSFDLECIRRGNILAGWQILNKQRAADGA